VLARSATRKEISEVLTFDENTLLDVVLDVLSEFLFCISSFACLQPRQLVGWAFFPSTKRQLQHADVEDIFRIIFVRVAATASKPTWRLFPICQDVAELLAVTALHKIRLGFIGLCCD
jgi:hypothetical protein